MRVHHKTPTLVSMWMLDVFCCALGCVTLLWLLNTRQAGDLNVSAKSALIDLHQARTDLRVALTSLDSTKLRLNADVQALTNQLAAMLTEKDDLARKLGIAESEAKSAQALLDAEKLALNSAKTKLDTAAKALANVREKADAGATELAMVQKKGDATAKELAADRTRADP